MPAIKPKILCVDDEAVILKTLEASTVSKKMNITVKTARLHLKTFPFFLKP